MIDLRSDTVTKPDASMRACMAEAQVGDDVYGEDPTVNRLQAIAAEMIGTEDALFCSSGTQSNLLALLTHCGRGDEYIVGQTAHTYKYEAGGAAVLGSIQPQPLEFETDGTLDLGRVEAHIKPIDDHFAKTTLLCLENTQGGKVLPMNYMENAAQFVEQHQLKFHLDGARVFNAAVKLGIDAKDIAAPFDTISVCLSKGLGAPVGSILCGSRDMIKLARRWRKMLGGGMRQAGILAAAGIYALQNNIERLSVDHENASILADGLSSIDEIEISPDSASTNMVFVRTGKRGSGLSTFMMEHGILINGYDNLRLVTHLDVSRKDIERVIESFHAFFKA
ncbi:L-allo-threonine aldolase, PLP-dependent [Desulfamplus magnetovallimortis]|uniref:L-allo-threonine aldolase, PLP-dependent n=1 Tax=Desulfamplus magnetovallimortis TaxID=1246637 RepID=A0A1W1H6U2_9BACT|nr:low-specificity L-threonine aldolase [Desulfamplus magnetovallimortis]SLM28192.1 L-allo-threonine aldolase, PLP-dependent [Desulfamplus magnetovallimortis]